MNNYIRLTVDQIKQEINSRSIEEQKEIGDYAISKSIEEQKQREAVDLIGAMSFGDEKKDSNSSLVVSKIPFSYKDKAFINKQQKNKDIQREKIKFTEKFIEIDGLKFPRRILRFSDVENIKGLEYDVNVFQDAGEDYFTFNAVETLLKAGKKIPTEGQMKQAADVFGGDYSTLAQILEYPNVGVCTPNGNAVSVNDLSAIWLATSTPNDKNSATFFLSSTEKNHGDIANGPKTNAHSLIFLQD